MGSSLSRVYRENENEISLLIIHTTKYILIIKLTERKKKESATI